MIPNSYGTDLLEHNDCHSPEDGKFCSGGGSAPKAAKTRPPTQQKLLDRLARDGQVAVNYGKMSRRAFGERELNAAQKLVKAGVLVRVGGSDGPMEIRSRAAWKNNKPLGWAGYGLYKAGPNYKPEPKK